MPRKVISEMRNGSIQCLGVNYNLFLIRFLLILKEKRFYNFWAKLGNHNHSVQQGTPFFHEPLFFVCLWINLMHFGPFCYLQNHYILLNKVSTVQCTGPSGFTIESLIEYLIAANPVLERYSIWTKSHQSPYNRGKFC